MNRIIAVGRGTLAAAWVAGAVFAAGAFCGTAFAQSQTGKPKAAVYIMGNPEGRDALRMAVNNFLIKSGKYQMVAVDAIDVVAKEHARQMSGSVSDAQIAKLGEDAGAKYVCVVERSELDDISYVATRMISVESKVAEFADMVKLPKGGDVIEIIRGQIGAMLGMELGPKPAPSATQSAAVAPPQPVPPLSPTQQSAIPPPPTVRDALSTIYFDYDRAELRPDAINAMVGVVNILREHKRIRVMVEGHANERGTSAYNMGLSESRARNVRDYLISSGISADRIQITSYGKERPANPNCNGVEECHAKNRRVEWRILSQ